MQARNTISRHCCFNPSCVYRVMKINKLSHLHPCEVGGSALRFPTRRSGGTARGQGWGHDGHRCPRDPKPRRLCHLHCQGSSSSISGHWFGTDTRSPSGAVSSGLGQPADVPGPPPLGSGAQGTSSRGSGVLGALWRHCGSCPHLNLGRFLTVPVLPLPENSSSVQTPGCISQGRKLFAVLLLVFRY